jgi:CO/xanthine dehydrogenase FAD-binding subunit
MLGAAGQDAIAAAADAVAAAADPSNDQRGSAAYKRAMARLWTQRLLSRLLHGGDR